MLDRDTPVETCLMVRSCQRTACQKRTGEHLAFLNKYDSFNKPIYAFVEGENFLPILKRVAMVESLNL